MKKYRAFFSGIIVGMICMLLVAFLSGGGVLSPAKNKYYRSLDASYGKYYKIIKLLNEEALAEYNPEVINDEVLKGIVAGLDDPYAQYYTADEYKLFEKKYSKSYIGIGISITDTDNKVVVVEVDEDGPAGEAGVKPGDVIVSVDGENVKDSNDASLKLSGENGTEVELDLLRDGKEMKLVMNRSRIDTQTVAYSKLDKKQKIAYIRIAAFREGTAREFELAVKDLKNDGYDKAVIDLRGNGGGSTGEAYKLADLLLPECVILKEVNSKDEEKIEKSKSGTVGIEYVLLVDGGTASASEMVAGAVKDNNGGKLIGTKTYGKGVTQITHKFRDGSAIKYTIEEFFRPSGKAINKVGIEPDITVDDAGDTKKILRIARDTFL